MFLIPEGARPFGKVVTSAPQPEVGEESPEGGEGRGEAQPGAGGLGRERSRGRGAAWGRGW